MNDNTHLVQLGDELRYGKTGLDVDLAIVTRDRNHKLAPHQVEALISHRTPLPRFGLFLRFPVGNKYLY